MKTRKWQAAIAATIVTLTLSSPAMAGDCAADRAQIDQLELLVQHLSCGGDWPPGNPIWQGAKAKGKNKNADVDPELCSIHEKLLKLIFEQRYEPGSTDPYDEKPKKNKHETNYARGAVHDLRDYKFQSAIDQLKRFEDTIEFDAVINPEFYPFVVKNRAYPDVKVSAMEHAEYFRLRAKAIRESIDPIIGCK